nr:hypothetical protein [Tanacetum cinerariifolium]
MLPVELTNDEIRNFAAYKEYYAIAIGATSPKTKASVRKKQSSYDTTMPPSTAAGRRHSTSAKGKQHAKSSKPKTYPKYIVFVYFAFLCAGNGYQRKDKIKAKTRQNQVRNGKRGKVNQVNAKVKVKPVKTGHEFDPVWGCNNNKNKKKKKKKNNNNNNKSKVESTGVKRVIG